MLCRLKEHSTNLGPLHKLMLLLMEQHYFYCKGFFEQEECCSVSSQTPVGSTL